MMDLSHLSHEKKVDLSTEILSFKCVKCNEGSPIVKYGFCKECLIEAGFNGPIAP
jgi:hypothetical protein